VAGHKATRAKRCEGSTAISTLSKAYLEKENRIFNSILKTAKRAEGSAAISTLFKLPLVAAGSRRGELRFDRLDFDGISRPAVDVDFNLRCRLAVGGDFAGGGFGNA
jgi:hypothetical protein